MREIVIGKSGKKSIAINLPILIRSKLLVQANSGGGKSWLLRRLAEQMFGKVPIILIDPEGEFATLLTNDLYSGNSSEARAPGLGPGGRRFDSCFPDQLCSLLSRRAII